MKTISKLLLSLGASALLLNFSPSVNAQTPVANSGGDNNEDGLFQLVTGIKTKTDKFRLYLNTHFNYTMDWDGLHGDHFNGGRFAFKQLRIEFKGQINDWISYRYRQRLNRGQSELGYFDNILKNIDIAEVGFRYKKVDFVLGKQCAAYGGFEYDLNPIEIYQYCDMIEYMDNFMTGVRAAWDISPTQQLQFQVLDAVTLNPGDVYGENIEKAKLPFVYTVNWNGSFGLYSTRWSASFMRETKRHNMWYFAFGNKFDFSPRCSAWLDVMYSREGIDRKGIITNDVGLQDVEIIDVDGQQKEIGHNAFNTEYFSMVLHGNWFVHPKWNLFAKVAWERNGVYKTCQGVEKGTYGIDYLYVGGLEFYPLKDRGLHFFLAYVGQNTRHTSRAIAYGQPQSSYTNRLSLGFIWQIPLF